MKTDNKKEEKDQLDMGFPGLLLDLVQIWLIADKAFGLGFWNFNWLQTFVPLIIVGFWMFVFMKVDKKNKKG